MAMLIHVMRLTAHLIHSDSNRMPVAAAATRLHRLMERDITHGCGHVRRHYLKGFYPADRDRDARRLARTRCADCRDAALQSASEAARRVLRNVVLPALAGSPRQVAWADGIRLKQLAALHRIDPGAVSHVAAMMEARWWIEHRSDDPLAMALSVDARSG